MLPGLYDIQAFIAASERCHQPVPVDAYRGADVRKLLRDERRSDAAARKTWAAADAIRRKNFIRRRRCRKRRDRKVYDSGDVNAHMNARDGRRH